MKMKPKTFDPVIAYYDGSDTTRYAPDLVSDQSPHLPAGSPVDMLLASLAYCIVKSVEWAAKEHNSGLLPFAVKVTGTKALDLPGRVEQMEVLIIGDLVAVCVAVPRRHGLCGLHVGGGAARACHRPYLAQ